MCKNDNNWYKLLFGPKIFQSGQKSCITRFLNKIYPSFFTGLFQVRKQWPIWHWPMAHQIQINSFCVMRQSWDGHETVLRQYWDSHVTVMIQSWDSHETVMRQSWDSHETVNYSTPVADFVDMFVLVCSMKCKWVSQWPSNRVATRPWLAFQAKAMVKTTKRKKKEKKE